MRTRGRKFWRCSYRNPDTFSYSRGWRGNERVAKRSATRWSTRSGGGIGPYHGDSSCTERSEGFSRRRLPRGWKWGLKRFRWETQQGVNGSRHAGGARNVSLEARRKRAGQRKGRGSRGETPGAHVHAHTRVACCYAWTGTHVRARGRAHSMSPKSAATPPLRRHHRYTTTTKVRGVFVHESWVYLVLSVRIQRRDAPSLRPSIFATARPRLVDISCENTRAYWRTLMENRWARDCKQRVPEMAPVLRKRLLNFLTKIVMQMIHCRSR